MLPTTLPVACSAVIRKVTTLTPVIAAPARRIRPGMRKMIRALRASQFTRDSGVRIAFVTQARSWLGRNGVSHCLEKHFTGRLQDLAIRCRGPVAESRNYQFALGVDVDALAENALSSKIAVIVSPPLIAIAAARSSDIRWLGGCLCNPILRQYFHSVRLAPIENELAHPGVV